VNFDLSEEQQVIADLANQIFEGQVTVDRLKDAERGTGWDEALWADLATANITGLCLPEVNGGSGMGMVELALLVQAQGRHLAPVPLLPTAVTAGAIAEFGVAGVHDDLLAAVVTGQAIVTCALAELGANDPLRPAVTATATDGGWRINGIKPAVPYAAESAAIAVTTRMADGTALVALVSPTADGVTIEPEQTTNHQPAATVRLDTVVGPDAVLGQAGDEAAEVTRWLFEHTLVGICAMQLGVAEGALAMTAEHVSSREQFGRPLSAFQAVTQRAADAWITTEAVRVTTMSAAWRLAEGIDARKDVAVAAYWATEGAQQVVTAAQHLHGGIGADVDYPVHRYYLWGVQNGTVLGSASPHLARLGNLLSLS
jgi:alkylation response protein AidB-like acyl-CoA dehydrogenase